MCYHNSLKKEAKEISEYYEASFEERDLFTPIFHAAGFSFPHWPIVCTEASIRKIELSEWGLIPSWAANLMEANRLRSTLLNARSETIFEKISFKNNIMQQRCLIPSTGYFEWQQVQKKKYPYFISLRNVEIFSIAGIINTWMDTETKKTKSSFALITTSANSCLEKIHNTKKRMPLIVHKSDEGKWLDNNLTETEIKRMMTPYPSEEILFHTVSNLISNFATKNSNRAEVSTPYVYPEFQQQRFF
ncbi:MAG: SOS response-associated peptidase [Bacteroidetes bacterium]|nr:SOS response-associated peptidase [Bacteroidota bacterium]